MENLEATLEAAVAAVRASSRVCRDVQRNLVTADAVEKGDRSPVTVADYASQAIVCGILEEKLPGQRMVGEEDSRDLRTPEQEEIRAAVARHVRGSLGSEVSEERVLEWIDAGRADAGGGRFWALDPIDGTKGFLRGEHYAVALGLVEDGRVVAGVLGCPNLPLGDERGALFAASQGNGARALPLWDAGAVGKRISVAHTSSPSMARFCESVESGHSNQHDSARIAELLGIETPPLRIDSQCKYAAVARGDASIYLRMPTRADYREKIWDHAAGKIVVEEAGGRVSDAEGRALDFGHGRTLETNRGVVATSGSIHDAVVRAVRHVLSTRSSAA